MSVTVKVLNQMFTVTEDEVENVLEVEISGWDSYFKIGDNKIEEGGFHTLWFDSDEDPFEVLYNAPINARFDNVIFNTKEMFKVYHPEFGTYIKTGLTRRQAEALVENAEYKSLEIHSDDVFVSAEIY